MWNIFSVKCFPLFFTNTTKVVLVNYPPPPPITFVYGCYPASFMLHTVYTIIIKPFYMKKTNSILLFLSILTALLISSCQKEALIKDNHPEKVIVLNVLTWLENQRLKSGPVNSERIQLLSEHLDLSSVSLENLNDTEKLVIIPLSASFRTINNKGKEVVNVFAIVLSADGTLKNGRIVQYAADNGRQQRILPSTIAKLYNRLKVNHNGKYRILTIADRYLYEIEYRNGNIYSYSTMQPKNNSVNRQTADGNGCIDWYIVTTITFADGSIWTYEEFVGRTCGGCIPNDPYNETEDCGDEEGSGSGGGGACDFDLETAQNILNSITTTLISNGGYASGAETAPDASGIIRKPVVVHNDGVTNNYGFGYSENHKLFFTGILFKNTQNAQWKWESLSYSDIQRVSGSTPPCISSNVSASVSGPIISTNKTEASYSAVVTTTVTVSCLAGAKVGTNISNFSRTYYAASY